MIFWTGGDAGEEGSIPDMARWGGHEDLAQWLEGVIAAKQKDNKPEAGNGGNVSGDGRTP